ncbi:hypothetical protein Sps_00756 [Shewanella psychrophila]|uniref:Uncharacterized protein n=1 Tax=Shewanella psychrophila TaxID=225848 RepID=A0A1S6HKA9_9GAMM|nr:hypothetical protein [Shewanella psychrophila]AQS35949.1 hypothetical protein Sps_00756 [Shewanella psychrophila]
MGSIILCTLFVTGSTLSGGNSCHDKQTLLTPDNLDTLGYIYNKKKSQKQIYQRHEIHHPVYFVRSADILSEVQQLP